MVIGHVLPHQNPNDFKLFNVREISRSRNESEDIRTNGDDAWALHQRGFAASPCPSRTGCTDIESSRNIGPVKWLYKWYPKTTNHKPRVSSSNLEEIDMTQDSLYLYVHSTGPTFGELFVPVHPFYRSYFRETFCTYKSVLPVLPNRESRSGCLSFINSSNCWPRI